jgi:hypothetical protein
MIPLDSEKPAERPDAGLSRPAALLLRLGQRQCNHGVLKVSGDLALVYLAGKLEAARIMADIVLGVDGLRTHPPSRRHLTTVRNRLVAQPAGNFKSERKFNGQTSCPADRLRDYHQPMSDQRGDLSPKKSYKHKKPRAE